ncbi:MAG TPA: DUF1566 domain-containing protein [Caldisericia bacterium]|nr:DUF1566 domain-containing protein [Caldisericia bacterium]
MKQNYTKIAISLVFLIGLSSFIFYGNYAKEAKGRAYAQSDKPETGLLEHIPLPWSEETTYSYPIVHTGQTTLYSDQNIQTDIQEGEDFYGQDGHYLQNLPSYKDNGDGTITDLVTGLMWQKTMDEKKTLEDAEQYAKKSTLAGYNDWRIPTIKELFSLIDYNGRSGGETAHTLYIDTQYFDQPLGDVTKGEREIDAQTWSSTRYVGKTMNQMDTIFGVNFIDGRIKGYPVTDMRSRSANKMYFRLVRGNPDYGKNQLISNEDGTITDLSTGLMWQMADDGTTRNWKEALSYAENLSLAGYEDWRLPSAKELQSIIDYTKSPQTTGTPAIYDEFQLTPIQDATGKQNWGFYWTGTTHLDGRNPYASAAYVCFGEALGKMNNRIMDVHGAGAVRSDPKNGNRSDYPQFFGPQGDIRYVYNFVFAVRYLSPETEDLSLDSERF